MSTRWYPIYQKGAPQLRVFLPNFWMKLVRPVGDQPPNNVQFSCSMEMTKYDIKNYLEKIYGIKSVHVRTRIVMGKTKPDPGKGYIIKEDDVKLAYVTLERGQTFAFPNLFPEDKEKGTKEEEKTLDEAKKGYSNYLEKNKDRSNLPGWFTM